MKLLSRIVACAAALALAVCPAYGLPQQTSAPAPATSLQGYPSGLLKGTQTGALAPAVQADISPFVLTALSGSIGLSQSAIALLKAATGVPPGYWDSSNAIPTTSWVATAYMPHVANLAALKLVTNYSQPVYRDGYQTPGDGGGATYIHSTMACSLSGGAGDGGGQASDATLAPNTGCWNVYMPDGVSRPEWWGPTGAVGTDDVPKIMAASRVFNNGGGVVKLRCGVQYQQNSMMPVGALTTGGSNTQPFVAVKGCTSIPKNIATFPGFTGQVDTLGGIWRAPGVSINMGQGGSLENLVVWQQGVHYGQDSSSNFDSSSAVIATMGATTGQSASLRSVLIVGGGSCFDSSSGASSITLEDVTVDCNSYGFNIGPSLGGSYFNNLSSYPYATAGFAGYTITGLSGTGATTTLTYSGTPTRAIAVGDFLQISGVTYTGSGSAAYTPAEATAQASSRIGQINAYWVVTSVGNGTLTFASTDNTTNNPVNISAGRLTDVNSSQYRPGTGFLISGHADDSYFGPMSVFGAAVGVDYEGDGISHFAKIYLDNNITLPLKMNPYNDSPIHIDELEALEVGTPVGLAATSSSGAGAYIQIDKADISNTVNPITVDGTSYVAITKLKTNVCSSYAANVAAGGQLHIDDFRSLGCGPSYPGGSAPALLTAGVPVSYVTFGQLSSDLPAGSNVFGIKSAPPSVSISGATINLPASTVSGYGKIDTYVVPGNGPYTLIGGVWPVRIIRLVFTGTGALVNSGDIQLKTNQNFQFSPGNSIDFFFDSSNGGAYGGYYREVGRNGITQPSSYTVANLPTCNAVQQDNTYIATDLTSATYGAAPTGNGGSRGPVYCNGSAYSIH